MASQAQMYHWRAPNPHTPAGALANPEHLAKLKEGVEAWNQWREQNPEIQPDLSGADLREANLSEADLSEANLRGTDLCFAHLQAADLRAAGLIGAYLIGADLSRANLNGA